MLPLLWLDERANAPLEADFAHLAQEGIAAVHLHCQAVPSEEAARRIARRAQAVGLHIGSLSVAAFGQLSAPLDDAAIDSVVAAIDLLPVLGAEAMLLGAEALVAQPEDLIGALLPILDEADGSLWLANRDPEVLAHLSHLLNEWNSPYLGLCCDPSTWLSAAEQQDGSWPTALADRITRFGGQIGIVHLRDAWLPARAAEPDLQTFLALLAEADLSAPIAFGPLLPEAVGTARAALLRAVAIGRAKG